MNDRLPLRDRTLILRILVPGLEARLRDKMKELEDSQQQQQSPPKSQSQSRGPSSSSQPPAPPTPGGGGGIGGGTVDAASILGKERVLDFEGVTCEPTTARNRTLWNFHCDGATYPARLVNLPCPLEVHKTHDHAMYYKCVDLCQMLVVYEDEMALEESDEKPIEGYPSYYPSGITPPMRRVVERRFAAREHTAVPPPRAAVGDEETELTDLMERLVRDEKTKRKNKVPTLTSATKILEEVEEEVVDFEEWMSDHGRSPHGVEFDADDPLCRAHPEVWLSHPTIRSIRDEEEQRRRVMAEAEAAAAAKKESKKESKKKAKKDKDDAAAALAAAASGVKKGIAAKKNREIIDEVTQAAASMMNMDGFDEFDVEDDDLFKLDFDDEEFKEFDKLT